MIYPAVREVAADGVSRRGGLPGAAGVDLRTTSGIARPTSGREWGQVPPMHAIRRHEVSHDTYGHRQIHAESTLGLHLAVSYGRVERLMRCAGRVRRPPPPGVRLHAP